jgi:alpha-aminoadipate carrier protein LysW
MPNTVCPECTESIFVEADSEQGDVVSCEECGTDLVVVGLDPIELDLKSEDDDLGSEKSDDFDSYGYDDSY